MQSGLQVKQCLIATVHRERHGIMHMGDPPTFIVAAKACGGAKERKVCCEQRGVLNRSQNHRFQLRSSGALRLQDPTFD